MSEPYHEPWKSWGATPGVPRGSAVQAETPCPWILTDLWSQRWVLEPPTSLDLGLIFFFFFPLLGPTSLFSDSKHLCDSDQPQSRPGPAPPPPAPESVPGCCSWGIVEGEFKTHRTSIKTPKKQKGPTAGVSNTKLTSFYPDEGARIPAVLLDIIKDYS